MISQFKNLMCYNCLCVSHFEKKMLDKAKNKIPVKEVKKGDVNYIRESASRLNKFT